MGQDLRLEALVAVHAAFPAAPSLPRWIAARPPFIPEAILPRQRTRYVVMPTTLVRHHFPYPSAPSRRASGELVKTLKRRAFRHSGQKLVTGVARP